MTPAYKPERPHLRDGSLHLHCLRHQSALRRYLAREARSAGSREAQAASVVVRLSRMLPLPVA